MAQHPDSQPASREPRCFPTVRDSPPASTPPQAASQFTHQSLLTSWGTSEVQPPRSGPLVQERCIGEPKLMKSLAFPLNQPALDLGTTSQGRESSSFPVIATVGMLLCNSSSILPSFCHLTFFNCHSPSARYVSSTQDSPNNQTPHGEP
jgi:hypothetical protein